MDHQQPSPIPDPTPEPVNKSEVKILCAINGFTVRFPNGLYVYNNVDEMMAEVKGFYNEYLKRQRQKFEAKQPKKEVEAA